MDICNWNYDESKSRLRYRKLVAGINFVNYRYMQLNWVWHGGFRGWILNQASLCGISTHILPDASVGFLWVLRSTIVFSKVKFVLRAIHSI